MNLHFYALLKHLYMADLLNAELPANDESNIQANKLLNVTWHRSIQHTWMLKFLISADMDQQRQLKPELIGTMMQLHLITL